MAATSPAARAFYSLLPMLATTN